MNTDNAKTIELAPVDSLGVINRQLALVEALKEMLAMGEMFIPAALSAPGFRRARAALSKTEGRA